MNMESGHSVLKMTLQITSKETGETREVQVIATPVNEEEIKDKDDGSNSSNGG